MMKLITRDDAKKIWMKIDDMDKWTIWIRLKTCLLDGWNWEHGCNCSCGWNSMKCTHVIAQKQLTIWMKLHSHMKVIIVYMANRIHREFHSLEPISLTTMGGVWEFLSFIGDKLGWKIVFSRALLELFTFASKVKLCLICKFWCEKCVNI